MKCKTCNGPTMGYKCEVCGDTSKKHDPKHSCGGKHCMSMCAHCKHAEAKCTC